MVRHDIRVQHLRLLSVERGWEGVGFWGLPFSRFLSVVTLLNNCLLCRHARINNTHNSVLSVNEIYVSLVSYWPFSVIVNIPIFFFLVLFFFFFCLFHTFAMIHRRSRKSVYGESEFLVYLHSWFFLYPLPCHTSCVLFFSFFFFLGSGFSRPIWICILKRILIFCFFKFCFSVFLFFFFFFWICFPGFWCFIFLNLNWMLCLCLYFFTGSTDRGV